MKILAIEKEMPGILGSDYKPWLEPEARKAWELHQEGLIRELYFTDDHCAVLILEARDKAHAREIVNQLPARSAKINRF